MSFSDAALVAQYVDNLGRQVPGVQALHAMAALLLAERVPQGGRVLVLGAGGGVELRAFAQAQPHWQLVGVDPSAEMLALAVRTLGDAASRVELVEGYVDAAPRLPFDGATCLLTLHFLPRTERLATLIELRRRLRPGAPLVVAHHSVPDDTAGRRAWYRRLLAFQATQGLDGHDHDVETRASLMAERLPTLPPAEEEALLREAGFSDPQLFYAALSLRGWIAYAD